MPTQTELEFYKAFGIEPVSRLTDDSMSPFPIDFYTSYPCINDFGFVELARLGFNQGFVIYSNNLGKFKEKLLKLLISNKTDDIYHAVRKIMGVE